MLDYTKILEDQGIVRFKAGAANYVTKEPGVYRVVAVPYCYSDGDNLAATMSTLWKYLHALDRAIMNKRDNITAKMKKNNGNDEAFLCINKMPKRVSLKRERSLSLLLNFAPFFPPLYIGQTENLRTRFRSHVNGNNSPILDRLSKHDLLEHAVFFH